MDSQERKETWKTWESKSQSRDGKLKTAIHNAGGDMDHLATSMIHAALWPLYASGKMSDLAVTCCGRRFLVHKAIVCPQSPFFDKACNSGFKEGIENIIDLPEEDPDTVDRFFQFLYAGNYSDGEYFYLLPSVAATMTPGAVSESLQKVSKPDNGEAPVFKTLGVSATVSSVNIEKDHPQENSEEDDKDYTSDAVDEEDEDPLEYDSEASKCTDPDDLYDSDLLYDEELNKDKLPPYITEYSTEHPISTFTSLRVYLMADKYDVPALKLLAKDRFIRTIESTWLAYDDFPAVIDELFELTIPDDPLRNFVCELIVCQYHVDPGLRARMKPLMEKHAGLTLGVLEKMVTLTHL